MRKKGLRSPRKLELSKETLRLLDDPSLGLADGAGPTRQATGPCLTCPQCLPPPPQTG